MKNNRLVKNIIFILIIIVISAIIYLFYWFVIEKKNPFTAMIDAIKESNINDNYNGIYVNIENLDKTYYIFNGCNINKIYNYILVKNDKYYAYRGSCMGTYFQKEGNTKDLKTIVDDTNDSFVIKYNDLEYKKDNTVKTLRPHNDVKTNLKDIELSSLSLIVDETQFEGNYYNLNRKPLKNNNKMLFSLDINENIIALEYDLAHSKKTVYQYYINDIKNLPTFYQYGNNVAVIEKDSNYNHPNMYGYNLVYVTGDGIAYNLREQFPISVDNAQLSPDYNSIFVKFNPSKREYYLLVGYDKKMCDDNYSQKDQNEIAYYEFTIKYNYLKSTFEKPEFKKIGYKSEGCNYVNNIIGG